MLAILFAGICLAISVPLLSARVLKANENRARNQLAVFRESLGRYLIDNNQRYPETLDGLVADHKYLTSIPFVDIPVRTPKESNPKYSDMKYSHRRTSTIYYGVKPNDAGGWFYDNVRDDPDYGNIRINCTHTDQSGKVWASY